MDESDSEKMLNDIAGGLFEHLNKFAKEQEQVIKEENRRRSERFWKNAVGKIVVATILVGIVLVTYEKNKNQS